MFGLKVAYPDQMPDWFVMRAKAVVSTEFERESNKIVSCAFCHQLEQAVLLVLLKRIQHRPVANAHQR
jgi:hypothetical protein